MQSASAPENYYDLLEIRREASRAEIRRAFLRMAHICHPDLNSDDVQAEIRFRHIRQAYEVLYDPTARAAYDDQLRGQVQPAACRQEWPRSKPIVTSPPERRHVDWNSFEATSPIERWIDWRTRNVVILGLSVAAIVLTTITTTHFRAIHRIREGKMDQVVALGEQIDARGESARPPSGPSFEERRANNSANNNSATNDTASDDSAHDNSANNSSDTTTNNDTTSKRSLPSQPSQPTTPVAPVPWAPMADFGEPMDSVMESVNSLKALQNSSNVSSFPAYDGTLPLPPRGPQLEWTPALNPGLPAPDSLPRTDLPLPLPAPPDPKSNHWPAPDSSIPLPEIRGDGFQAGTPDQFHYDGGDYQEPSTLFGFRPPTTRSALPSRVRSGSPEPSRGRWAPNRSSSVFSAPISPSGWGRARPSSLDLANPSTRSLNSSGWKAVPRAPSVPTMPNFPPPVPAYPKRSFGSTTLGAAQISPYADDYP